MKFDLEKIKQRSVRQFYLINDVGDMFDLTSTLDTNELYSAFMHSPSGLGFAMDDVYNRVFHYDILTSRSWVNSDVSGEMMFRSYEEYTSFMYFISHTRETYLVYVLPYTTDQIGSYIRPRVYAQVSVTSVAKSEISETTSLLECDTSFHLLEPWKTQKMIRTSLDINTGDETKTYDVNGDSYAYDINGDSYVYGRQSGDFLIINNYGSAPTFPVIKIKGVSDNPTISTFDYASGDNLQTISFDITLTDSDVLELNGDPLNQYINLNGSNAYDYINKDLDSYIVLPPGKSVMYFGLMSGSVEVDYEIKFYSI